MKTGIIIIAMGGKVYLQEARANIRAIWKNWPGARITVFTHVPESFGGPKVVHRDTPQGSPDGKVEVIEVEDLGGFKNQTRYVRETPYEATLHLDCDAIPLKPTAFQPFRMLERFDFVAAHAMARNPEKSQGMGLPGCFTQWNCGVMFYNKGMIPIFQDWDKHFPDRSHNNPQGALARRLWKSEALRVYTLAPEWNYRGELAHLATPDMIQIGHSHHVPRMVRQDGSVDPHRFRGWFWSRTIRKLNREGRVGPPQKGCC